MWTNGRAARALAALTVVVAGVAGCAPEPAGGEAAAAAAEQAAPAQTPAALSDAEIAAIVVTANSIDVQYGEIARERATREDVRQFAETMITDHTAVNESAGALVARLGVTPVPSDVSRSLEEQAEETRAQLRTKSGLEFDRAYIDNEVAYHRAVLSALDELLIPAARNAELRETLVSVRPAFVAHLEHAESLKTSLSSQ